MKSTLLWLNFNNLLAPKTLSVTFGDPARILLPLTTALAVGKDAEQDFTGCPTFLEAVPVALPSKLQGKHRTSACRKGS